MFSRRLCGIVALTLSVIPGLAGRAEVVLKTPSLKLYHVTCGDAQPIAKALKEEVSRASSNILLEAAGEDEVLVYAPPDGHVLIAKQLTAFERGLAKLRREKPADMDGARRKALAKLQALVRIELAVERLTERTDDQVEQAAIADIEAAVKVLKDARHRPAR